jgi:ABC-2 type transport system permease protein
VIKSVKIVQVFLKHWYRRKSTIFWTILFPILLITIFGSIFSNMGQSEIGLYVQNLDFENGQPTPLSQALIDTLNRTDVFTITMVNASQDLDDVLKGASTPRALIIPEGFGRDTYASLSGNTGPPAAVTLKRDQSQVTDPAPGVIATVIRQFSTYLMVNSTRDVITVREEVGEGGFRYIDFFVPGVIGMTVMTTGLMGAVNINTEYRMNGVLRKLATTPLSKLDWILGVVLYEVLIAFVAAAIIIGLGYLPVSIFDVHAVLTVPAVLLIFAGTLAFPGMGMILARFVRDPTAADAAANAIAFPMMFLSGTFFPIEMYPEFLKPIAQILPLTYLNDGLRAAMINNQPDIAFTNTVIVTIIAVISIGVGVVVTSWREK